MSAFIAMVQAGLRTETEGELTHLHFQHQQGTKTLASELPAGGIGFIIARALHYAKLIDANECADNLWQTICQHLEVDLSDFEHVCGTAVPAEQVPTLIQIEPCKWLRTMTKHRAMIRHFPPDAKLNIVRGATCVKHAFRVTGDFRNISYVRLLYSSFKDCGYLKTTERIENAIESGKLAILTNTVVLHADLHPTTHKVELTAVVVAKVRKGATIINTETSNPVVFTVDKHSWCTISVEVDDSEIRLSVDKTTHRFSHGIDRCSDHVRGFKPQLAALQAGQDLVQNVDSDNEELCSEHACDWANLATPLDPSSPIIPYSVPLESDIENLLSSPLTNPIAARELVDRAIEALNYVCCAQSTLIEKMHDLSQFSIACFQNTQTQASDAELSDATRDQRGAQMLAECLQKWRL